jgi:hypothetical protein
MGYPTPTHEWLLDDLTDSQGSVDLEVGGGDPSLSNGVASYDGDDYHQTNANLNFGSDSFAIAIRFQLPSAPSFGDRLLAVRVTHGFDINFRDADGNVGVFIKDVSGDGFIDNTFESSGLDLADGEWHEVVVVADRASDIAHLYVDGALEETQDPAGWGDDINPDAPLTIASSNGGGNYSEVYVDTVRIWVDTLLTEDDVLDLWNEGKGLRGMFHGVVGSPIF